eukprot:TRINITY_DN30433_c0_g1_i1.p2 TRINITY_DN30433_c0_g1~~TRINITY_DN30433_c0_g1_i1.p2  ORF type:complete len:336 (+),score=156.59 TRINITY_DN30433_c0_g1_i1:63-1010(+)
MAERRRDPTNPPKVTKTYTHAQFVEFYGKKQGQKMWAEAGERRPDPTNPPGSKKTYTRDQFLDFYGPRDGKRMWAQAGSAPAKKKPAAKEKPVKVTVGYWGIRGLGAPLRMMCCYKGADVTDKRYTDPDEWFKKDKPELQKKNALMNLPYVKIGGTVVTQSTVCLQFLGRKLGIDGEVTTFNDQVVAQVFDLRNDLMEVVYPFTGTTKETFPEVLKKHWEKAAGHFAKLEAFCRGDYMCGKRPQSGDFHLFEMIDQHEMMAKSQSLPSIFEGDKLPKLKALHKRMREHPKLAKYFDSDAVSLPVNSPAYAHWTGL